ncbi:hypothetical protein Tco_0716167, partial [Tanacetum coccineum]
MAENQYKSTEPKDLWMETYHAVAATWQPCADQRVWKPSGEWSAILSQLQDYLMQLSSSHRLCSVVCGEIQVAAMNSDSHDDNATVACFCVLTIVKYYAGSSFSFFSVDSVATVAESMYLVTSVMLVVFFVSLVPGSIGITVSLLSSIPASF